MRQGGFYAVTVVRLSGGARLCGSRVPGSVHQGTYRSGCSGVSSVEARAG